MVRIPLVMAVLAAGSASFQTPVYRSDPELFSDRWVGHPEDDVLMQYGAPTEVLQLSSGNRIDSYHKEVFVSSSSGGAYGQVASTRSASLSPTDPASRNYHPESDEVSHA